MYSLIENSEEIWSKVKKSNKSIFIAIYHSADRSSVQYGGTISQEF